MAFRTSLDTHYRKALNTCTSLKKYLTDLHAAMAAGSVSGNTLIDLHERLIRDGATLQESAAIPGMADYAASQENDPEYDVGAEFTAVVAAGTAIRDYLVANTSTISSGWVTFANGGVSTKSFNSTATATLRGLIQALIDTIE